MTDWEGIEDLDIRGLPKLDEGPIPRRVPITVKDRQRCIPPSPHVRSHCSDIDHVVKVYSLEELFATAEFYQTMQKNIGLVKSLQFPLPVGPHQINLERQMYFAKSGLQVPDPMDIESYESFTDEHPENAFFDYLVLEYSLLKTFLEAPAPGTREEVRQRFEEVLPQREYRIITCCARHLESTIWHCVQGTWEPKESGFTSNFMVPLKTVEDNSLVYAPDSRLGPRAHLSSNISLGIRYHADQMLRIFEDIVNAPA